MLQAYWVSMIDRTEPTEPQTPLVVPSGGKHSMSRCIQAQLIGQERTWLAESSTRQNNKGRAGTQRQYYYLKTALI